MHSAFHFNSALGRLTPIEMAARGGSTVEQKPRIAALAELRKVGNVILMSVSTHVGDPVLTTTQAVRLQSEFRSVVGTGRASGVYTGKVLTLYISHDDGRTFQFIQNGRTFFGGHAADGHSGNVQATPYQIVVLRDSTGQWNFKYLDPTSLQLRDMVVDRQITDALGAYADPTELFITPELIIERSHRHLISTFNSRAAVMVHLANDPVIGLVMSHVGEFSVKGHVLFGADGTGMQLITAGVSFEGGVTAANVGQVAKAQVVKQIMDGIVAAHRRLKRHPAATPAASSSASA